VDIIVSCTQPLDEKEWDMLDEAVNASDGSLRNQGEGGKIIICQLTIQSLMMADEAVTAGLLPPPLTEPSASLHRSDAYNLHVGRLTQLSLHANVYLKTLPPILDSSEVNDVDGGKWWDERIEVERVVRMYRALPIRVKLSQLKCRSVPLYRNRRDPRILFGTSPALPPSKLAGETQLRQPVSSEEWYAMLRKCFADLSEGEEAMSGLMGGNAAGVYGLQ